SNKFLLNFYNEVIQELPDMSEPFFNLVKVYSDLNDLSNATSCLDNALKLCKNNSYKDIILMEKANILNKQGKHQESFNLADEILKRNLLSETLRTSCETIRDKNIDPLKDLFL